MAYSRIQRSSGGPVAQFGRRFPCSPGLNALRRYHLGDEHRLLPDSTPTTSLSLRFVVVLATDADFYNYSRIAISSVQDQFAEVDYRLIVYILDGELEAEAMEELKSVCRVEVRHFDSWSHLPTANDDLRNHESFAWKLLIIAEVWMGEDGWGLIRGGWLPTTGWGSFQFFKI
jgi:Protein of unknown function (DUF1647)